MNLAAEWRIMNNPNAELMEMLINLRRQLESVARGDAATLVAQFAHRHGKSKQTVWRWLSAHAGYQTARKKRSDAGTTKLPEATLQFIAASKHLSVRANGKATKPTAVAMNIADANGMDVPVSVGTVNRILRQRKLDAKSQASARNHGRLRSLHPNHVHEIDPSLCLVFYLGKRQMIMTEQQFNKNKPVAMEKIKLKCWRYVRWDHASRALDVRYYQAAGENQYNLFEFLLHTWGRKDHRLSHGVPRQLLWDKGSERSSPAVCNWLDAMNVEHIPHGTHHAWVKGGVEKANHVVEMQFESRLRDQPVGCVEELNEASERWIMDFNANTIKFVEAGVKLPDGEIYSRDHLWQTILRHPDALVLLPEEKVCRWFLTGKTIIRTIRDNHISFVHPEVGVSRQYSLAQWAEFYSNNDKVQVSPLLMADGAVRVTLDRLGQEPLLLQVTPVADFDAYGRSLDNAVIGEEFKAAPHTAAERAAKLIAQTAYGDVTREEAEELLRKNVRPFQHFNDGKGVISHGHLGREELPPRILPAGRELNLPQAQEPELQRLNPVQMLIWLRGMLKDRFDPGMRAELMNRFPDGATVAELELVVADIDAGRTAGGKAKLKAL